MMLILMLILMMILMMAIMLMMMMACGDGHGGIMVMLAVLMA